MTPATAPFDEPSLDILRTRTSAKWRQYPSDVLPAFVAEMDFQLAPAVSEALVAAVRRGDTGYAAPSPELTEALAGFVRSRFSWDLRSSTVLDRKSTRL